MPSGTIGLVIAILQRYCGNSRVKTLTSRILLPFGSRAVVGLSCLRQAAAHGFEHLGHLGVLAEEVVHVLRGSAGASGDALAAAAVDKVGVQILLVGYGVDDGPDTGELGVVDVLAAAWPTPNSEQSALNDFSCREAATTKRTR